MCRHREGRASGRSEGARRVVRSRGCTRRRTPTSVPARVSPTEAVRAEIDELFGSGRAVAEVLEEVMRFTLGFAQAECCGFLFLCGRSWRQCTPLRTGRVIGRGDSRGCGRCSTSGPSRGWPVPRRRWCAMAGASDQHRHQRSVAQRPRRLRPALGGPIRGPSHLQRGADGRDSELIAVLVNEPHSHRCRRSSSAPKKVAARTRISFARRNSRFS